MTRLRRRAGLAHAPSGDTRSSMTPMIDVTFLLLVFFLCTLQFKSLEGRLAAYLPRDVGQARTPAESTEPVVVRIEVVEPGRRVAAGGAPYSQADAERGRRFDFDATRRLRYSLGAARTASLGEVRAQLARFDPTAQPAELDVLAGVTQGEVVAVLEVLADLRFETVRFRAAAPD